MQRNVLTSGYAQELKIGSLIETREILSVDKQRRDANGSICALLRVILPEEGASFEGNIVGSVNYMNGEYWVYVSTGTKSIRVKYRNLKPIMLNATDYSMPGFNSKTIYEVIFDNKALIAPNVTTSSQTSTISKETIIIKGFQDGPGQRAKLYINGKYNGELLPGNAHWKTIEGKVGEKCKVKIIYESKYERKRTRRITVRFGEHHCIETQSTAISAY